MVLLVHKNIIMEVNSMYSFKTVSGENIPFESKCDLSLDLQKDIANGEVTAYLVDKDGLVYEVSKETYNAIMDM